MFKIRFINRKLNNNLDKERGILINRFVTLAIAFFIFTSCSSVGTAVELTVQPGESIQSVVDNASSGDEIVISPGNYNENIIITKDNIVLRSSSGNPEDTIITANNNASNVLSIDADNITIMGLTITGAGFDRSGIFRKTQQI